MEIVTYNDQRWLSFESGLDSICLIQMDWVAPFLKACREQAEQAADAHIENNYQYYIEDCFENASEAFSNAIHQGKICPILGNYIYDSEYGGTLCDDQYALQPLFDKIWQDWERELEEIYDQAVQDNAALPINYGLGSGSLALAGRD